MSNTALECLLVLICGALLLSLGLYSYRRKDYEATLIACGGLIASIVWIVLIVTGHTA